MSCAQCEDDEPLILSDPRNPPLDTGECLCRECGLGAYLEAIESAMSEVARLVEEANDHGLDIQRDEFGRMIEETEGPDVNEERKEPAEVETIDEAARYRAFRNFMVNELGVTREDIRRWIGEAVALQVSNMLTEQKIDAAVNTQVDRAVREAVHNALGLRPHWNSKSAIVEKALAAILAESVSISIAPKPVEEDKADV